MLAERQKVAIAIDHSNLRHTCQQIKHIHESKKINYLKLVRYLADFHGQALYKVVFLNREVAGNPLCHFFDQSGFETIEKKPKQMVNSRNGVSSKCNLDVDIAIVVMQMIFDRDLYPTRPDKIVVVAGDSDFEGLGHTIVHYGIDVEFAFLSQGFARELRENFPCEVLDNLPVWDKRFST